MYDTDRSGCITKEEVASMLRVSKLMNLILYNYCNTPSKLRLYIIFTRTLYLYGEEMQALPDDCLPVDITEPGKLDEIFDRMDANSDGKVTFDEFKAAMQIDSSLKDLVLSSLRPS